MRTISVLLTLVIVFANGIAYASKGIVPFRPATDTSFFLRLAMNTRVFKEMRAWEMTGIAECDFWMSHKYSSENPGTALIDSTAHLTLRFLPPARISPNRVRYGLTVTFLFRDSVCVNDDVLERFCRNVETFIKETESVPGVDLFLKRTITDSGHILCSYDGICVHWFAKRDTLSYCGLDAKDTSIVLVSHDSMVLQNLSLYLGKWTHRQIEEFKLNWKIRYARIFGDQITISSGTEGVGEYDSFITSFTSDLASSFRLSNSLSWTTFPELDSAQAAVIRYLQSSGKPNCAIDSSTRTGVSIRLYDPDYGRNIYVGIKCRPDSEPKFLVVPLLDYNIPGEVTTAHLPLPK